MRPSSPGGSLAVAKRGSRIPPRLHGYRFLSLHLQQVTRGKHRGDGAPLMTRGLADLCFWLQRAPATLTLSHLEMFFFLFYFFFFFFSE